MFIYRGEAKDRVFVVVGSFIALICSTHYANIISLNNIYFINYFSANFEMIETIKHEQLRAEKERLTKHRF